MFDTMLQRDVNHFKDMQGLFLISCFSILNLLFCQFLIYVEELFDDGVSGSLNFKIITILSEFCQNYT